MKCNAATLSKQIWCSTKVLYSYDFTFNSQVITIQSQQPYIVLLSLVAWVPVDCQVPTLQITFNECMLQQEQFTIVSCNISVFLKHCNTFVRRWQQYMKHWPPYYVAGYSLFHYSEGHLLSFITSTVICGKTYPCTLILDQQAPQCMVSSKLGSAFFLSFFLHSSHWVHVAI